MLDRHEVLVCLDRPERLDDPAARAAALALLTPEERERVERFHFERDRRLHLAAGALLRRSLSRCAAVDPAGWRFEAEPGGRPFVASPATPLRFSVSHTRGLAVVAVAVETDVGVDAEGVPDAVPVDVVESAFTEAERAALAGTPPAERPGAFAAIWTLKEAYAKARGLGLALPFESFGFDLAPPRLASGGDPGPWYFECLRPTPRHRAALCVGMASGRPPRVLILQDV